MDFYSVATIIALILLLNIARQFARLRETIQTVGQVIALAIAEHGETRAKIWLAETQERNRANPMDVARGWHMIKGGKTQD